MAEINFLPVCSKCHRVLYSQTIGVETDIYDSKTYPIKIPYSRISPSRCQYCGVAFSAVTIPTELPFYKSRPLLSLIDED